MRLFIFGAFAGALTLTACNSEPFPGPLNGNWGGDAMQVTATRSSVVMTLGCGASVRIMHAVILDNSGKFAVTDSVRGSFDGGMRDTLPNHPVATAQITGFVSGDVLTVSVDPIIGDVPSSDTDAGAPIFTGHRGQPETELICRS